jgi:hypothetical protein
MRPSGIYWSLSIIFLKQLTHQFILANADQQEMFERGIGRSTFFQQQQQQQHVPQLQALTHSCSNNRDLDSQFANLSLKHSYHS